MRVIDLLAQKNDDWIRMAKSFKITDDQANEIVQEMYLRMYDYTKDVKKLCTMINRKILFMFI